MRDVDTEISARDAAFGADPAVTRGILTVAGGLFALTALLALLGELATLPGGLRPLYGLVLLGAVLAAVAAYRNSGLIVSWLLAFAPAAGALAVRRVVFFDGAVAVPGSFGGTGAAEFWVPVALLFGTLAFGVGVAARWTVGAVQAG